MKIKKNALLVIAILVFFGCKRNEITNPISYKISGTLYYDCNKEPLANMQIRLNQEPNNFNGNGGGILGQTMTDNEGRFEFNFKLKGKSDLAIDYLGVFAYSDIISGIPSEENIEELELYMNASYNLKVVLDVKNSYTNMDTLIYAVPKENKIEYLAGPFTSGVLYIMSDIKLLNLTYPVTESWFDYRIGKTIEESYAYKIDKICSDTNIVVVPMY